MFEDHHNRTYSSPSPVRLANCPYPRPHAAAHPGLPAHGQGRRVMPAMMTRRRRTRVLSLLAMLLGVECGAAMLTSPRLAIKAVRVTGAGSLPASEARAVLDAVAVAPGRSWFLAPRARIASHIRQMPWVRGCSIEGRFPDLLLVRVLAREPTAIAESGATRIEMDAASVPIRPARPDVAAVLPHVILPDGIHPQLGTRLNDPAVMAAVSVLEKHATDLPVHIAKIEVDQSDNICLNMRDTTSIELGQAEELDEKMTVVRRIYQRQPDIADSLTVINVTCPTRPACKLRAVEPSGSSAQPVHAVRLNR